MGSPFTSYLDIVLMMLRYLKGAHGCHLSHTYQISTGNRLRIMMDMYTTKVLQETRVLITFCLRRVKSKTCFVCLSCCIHALLTWVQQEVAQWLD